MEKEEISLQSKISQTVESFLEKTKDKETLVISHFDADGISSAAILITALNRADRKFSVKVIKSLEKKFIMDLPKDKVIIFLDLASGSTDYMVEAGLQDVFIIDHHEITKHVPEEIEMINPQLHNKEKISSSSLTYLFCKEINSENKDLAKTAIIGMIGDRMDQDISQLNNKILEEGKIKRKRGLIIYPATRPINRVLEYSSQPFIPGVTGDIKGVLELLREVGLKSANGKYKNIADLTEEEMEKIVTAISLRTQQINSQNLVGDIFLIKQFNKLEDARELCAKVNACSRSGNSELAIQFLMGVKKIKKKAEFIHNKYKQALVSGLKIASNLKNEEGKGFVIINAQDQIKDTMIGTIASIISGSTLYQEGTMIIAMAYYDDKIKISSRNSGREKGRNVREILDVVIKKIGGEVGGHEFAAGGIIKQEQEKDFITSIKKHLEIELVKI
ncbi:DHH family phosphoesterase [Nanoarchaeota archaeon]